jgi:acyl-CoA reductase-like NAD-dependent aldehyde dehydrogenase
MPHAVLRDELRDVRNPATGESLARLPDTPLDEVDAVVSRAVAAQRRWSLVPRHERAAIMRRYAESAREHAAELADLLSREQGKPLQQARDEISLHCRLFEGFAHRVVAAEERAVFLDSQPGLERDLQVTRHEPLGVVAAIIPFNFPIELYAHKVAPAIAAGNAVVIKPSEETPLATGRAVELLHAAGVPRDVVAVVHGAEAVGRRLVDNPRTVAQGATLAAGGARDGCFMRPTVLAGVTAEMDVARDMEVFGPVLAVLPAGSDDEAVAIANATRYGLSGSVFSRDVARATAIATRLETGQVVVNGTGLYRSDVMAFGGYKNSGLGREGLAVSLDEYQQTKTITFAGLLPAAGAGAS